MFRFVIAIITTVLLFVSAVAGAYQAIPDLISEWSTAGWWRRINIPIGMMLMAGFSVLFGIWLPYQMYWARQPVVDKNRAAGFLFGGFSLLVVLAFIFGKDVKLVAIIGWLVILAGGYWAALKPIDWQTLGRQLRLFASIVGSFSALVGIVLLTLGALNRPQPYTGRGFIELMGIFTAKTPTEDEFMFSVGAMASGAFCIALALVLLLYVLYFKKREA